LPVVLGGLEVDVSEEDIAGVDDTAEVGSGVDVCEVDVSEEDIAGVDETAEVGPAVDVCEVDVSEEDIAGVDETVKVGSGVVDPESVGPDGVTEVDESEDNDSKVDASSEEEVGSGVISSDVYEVDGPKAPAVDTPEEDCS